mmetsp:Transcript_22158/g.33607  ORF Transcript_22158/g.33607 Transcript_22158/m.33607 type:complete len:247 (+) Transcript_22158:156-896(+)|eukprot:CAMPEP_0194253608 /NCGR_PEP_ID=MMETSP0158-20130606/30219_1 /TAXON_ID=33649 /ORGANISM="Thalassionema nitzschioides, Strain L26-B" /LENGTH=246 /DNA_ID=CAMNT_0038991361 /DNA_START=45 /DNA_END=785 /DNA_ORIENTATION=+
MKREEGKREGKTNDFRISYSGDGGHRQEEKALIFLDENEQGDRQEEIELQVSHDIWEKMYKHAKLELEENAKEIHNLKEKLVETDSLLNAERGKVRHLHALNKRLERDVDQLWLDQEELKRDSTVSRQLLASKDKEIESLVAQINLLIQVGTMRRIDTSRNRRVGNTESNTDLISQGTHGNTIALPKSSPPSSERSEKDGGVIDHSSQPTIEKKSRSGFQLPASDKINQNIQSVTNPLKKWFHIAM